MKMDGRICSHDQCGQLLGRDTMAFILAGGRGSRLKELTDNCAKPGIAFGGRHRIIDFALSNAVNSGIRRIGVATQYRHDSLIRHIARISNILRPGECESFDCLPGSQHPGDTRHYRGTADAVAQNIAIIRRYAPKLIVVLAGDHVYKMDYELMLRQHVSSGADVTVGCIQVPSRAASGFGIMATDESDRITAFVEKPRNPATIPGSPGISLASMGIYVFNTAFLLDELRRDADDPCSTNDFGTDIIPHVVRHGRAFAHRFSTSCVRTGAEIENYWRDVGTLDAYFDANLDLVSQTRRFEIEDRTWPMWTDGLSFPAGGSSRQQESVRPLLFGGSLTSGEGASRNMIFSGVEIDDRASVQQAVILPNCRIGPDARLNRVIVDSGVCVPAGLVVGEDPDFDARRFRRTENGVCLITQKMIDQLPDLLSMRSAA